MTNQEAMNSYVFAFNKLSWINVDRFYHMAEEDKQVIVMKSDGDMEGEKVLILFKNINSILRMRSNEGLGAYVQAGFPSKEEVVIFAYKVENGKPMLCYREIDGLYDYKLDYMETSFAEIKGILSQFDKKEKG